MTRIFTCAIGAMVLASGIASAQAQAPTTSGGQSGTRTTGTSQSSTRTQKPAAARSTTYTGCLQGSAAEGYTISVLPNGAAQRNANAGTAGAQMYTVTPGTGVTTDLSTMTNKRVEIVGTLAPETGGTGTPSTSGVGTSGAGANRPGGNQGANTNAGGANTNAGGGNTSAGGNTAAGGYGNSGANTTANSANAGHTSNMSGNAHRSVTFTSVRVVPGSCTQ